MKEIKKWFIWNGIASIGLIGGMLTGYQSLAENIFSLVIGILLSLWFVMALFWSGADPRKYPSTIDPAKEIKDEHNTPFFIKKILDILYIIVLMRFGFNKLAFLFILEFPLMAYKDYALNVFLKKVDEMEKECNK